MMEGIKGGGRVGVGEEDMGDGMQCSDHPYRNNPGGICAFCLQEKLGKLVSSSFPLPIRGGSSSSSSPSFRSDGANGGAGSSSSLSLSIRPTSTTKGINDGGGRKDSHYHDYYTRRARIPFLLGKKKKKVTTVPSSDRAADIVFKRSKSTTTPRRNRFMNADDDEDEDISPRKRGGFWSFLYFSSSSSTSSSSSKPTASKPIDKSFRENSQITTLSAAAAAAATTNGTVGKQKEKCVGSSLGKKTEISEEDDSPNSQGATASASSFERKVSRSRSVGCGSRSFSGDFFERISTGFGDCTLRRVESQREGKPKVSASAVHRGGGDHHCHMKERVKCGGIFGGFMITSSSSSSSSSSYWLSTSADQDMNGKPLAHGRNKSWGWAFASPMRAFSKPSSKDGKRDIVRQASDKNKTPDLAAIPSLLAVRG